MKILVATGNEHKVQEIREIVKRKDWQVSSLREADIEIHPEETGETFAENSRIKAEAVAAALGADWQGFDVVLADDSGLEIDALHGAPGVHSARYLGEQTSHAEKRKGILGELADVPEEERTARFVCVVTAAFPDGNVQQTEGVLEGSITREERGENGFGYDAIFLPLSKGQTNAELSEEEKNAISHRGQAVRKMGELLQERESGKG